MIARVRAADSPELQRRLSILKPEERAQIIGWLQEMKISWCEEIEAKFMYWEELPHALCAICPRDGESRRFAAHCLHKFNVLISAFPAAQLEVLVHRITYRLMHPESGHRFRGMIEHLAATGEMLAELEIELQDIANSNSNRSF